MNNKTKKLFVGVIAGLTVVCLLASCGTTPPKCGEEQTMALGRKLILDYIRKIPGINMYFTNASVVDPDGLLENYLAALKIDFSIITSNGYDASAKKRSCHAQLTIKGPVTESTQSISYVTQLIEDKPDTWVFQFQGGNDFGTEIASQALDYLKSHKYAGNWNGAYACAGLDGENSGAKGPFTLQVSALIDNENRITLERKTAGGGHESLAGNLDFDTGKLWLKGQGENSPDDRWSAEYVGAISGTRKLQATGSINPENSSFAGRQCTLSLQRKIGDKTAVSDPVKIPNIQESKTSDNLLAPAINVFKVPNIVGTEPGDIWNQAAISAQLVSMLGDQLDQFKSRLIVSPPVAKLGVYYFGSGCTPHSCGSEAAAFSVHSKTGQVVAAYIEDEGKLHYFGVQSEAELPKPIKDWYVAFSGRL